MINDNDEERKIKEKEQDEVALNRGQGQGPWWLHVDCHAELLNCHSAEEIFDFSKKKLTRNSELKNQNKIISRNKRRNLVKCVILQNRKMGI